MQNVYCKVVIYVQKFQKLSEVPLMYGKVAVVTGLSVDVRLSVGISVTVGVPSNIVRVVIVLTKNIVKIISLVL